MDIPFSALGIIPSIYREKKNCQSAFKDEEKLPLWGDEVGSYSNPSHVLICSNISLLFLCNLQILPLMLVSLANEHSRRGNNEPLR